MKTNKQIKIHFQIKSKKELNKLSHKELLKYVKELTDNIHQEKPKKDSHNSSIAPSTEIAPKKNQSLREPSNKKSGGQQGRIGSTLTHSDNPDNIISLDYNIDKCKKCDSDLNNIEKQLKEKRQVLDIELSKLKTKITQFQSFCKICPICSFNNHDNSFPSISPSYMSYGTNIISIVVYLNAFGYISYNRIVLIMSNLFNINLSIGVIDKMIKKASKLSTTEIKNITKAIKNSDIVGIDETGCKINKNKNWHWSFQDSKNTLIIANSSRGRDVIKDNFKNGFPNACVVHDNYSSYSKLNAKKEQLCLAHKLRDLNYAYQCDNHHIIKDLKLLIKDAIKEDKEASNDKLTLLQRIKLKNKYENKLEYLIYNEYDSSSIQEDENVKSETLKQINSFKKAHEKNQIFTFLEHPDIPPDNNASERSIRNVKVKLKVSGQFKSFQGASDYATIRSIIDTSRKRGLNEFESLVKVVSGVGVFGGE